MKVEDNETVVGIKGNDLNDIFEQHIENQLLLKKQMDNDKIQIQSGCRQEQKSPKSSNSDSDQLGLRINTKTGKKKSDIYFDQKKTAIKILQGKCDEEIEDEIVYSFVPEKRCLITNEVLKRARAGPLTLSRRMSSKLAKSTDALESPFFVCRLSFSPTRNSRRREIDVKTSTKMVKQSKRRTFGNNKAKKLPTRF
jgi:hypothetical protein